nr:hypothetical protein [Corynebacterium cyclohexanicum]
MVHDVGDRFHGFGVGAFAEVFPGREEPHAKFVEVSFGDRGVNEVAEGTGAGVDNHEVDVSVFSQELHHVLEDWPLLDGLG